ncbi:MAG TPA: DUF2855 family protein [Burkholderiaceae bacterium]|nr:DUF2855 family protein [Burkholderiaceae bacterium]
MTTTFVVERHKLNQTRWVHSEPAPLAQGDVRLAIASFALTSNNVTYAAFGEAMNYWGFFPTGDAATGCIPVWGFADVTESRCDGVAIGERFYGYWPIANEVVLQPTRLDAAGFSDGAAHRRELHAVYNRYLRCSADPGYDAAREAEQALLRPLFFTSFLIDDFLADNDFFGARTVILSSASSKTAYGTAFCLAQRRGTTSAVRIVGLTSHANLGFTRGLGCYDEVLDYDAVATLPVDAPAVYVDFSGSVALRAAVHGRFGDRLAYSCSVGGTHWDDLGSGKGLPGPRPTLFFAPAQIKKRNADWGPAGLRQRLAAAWLAFMRPVTDARQPWLRVVRGHGAAAIESTYAALLGGSANPAEGHVLSV